MDFSVVDINKSILSYKSCNDDKKKELKYRSCLKISVVPHNNK